MVRWPGSAPGPALREFMRIGIGYDVHRLVRNRKLIIGGVTVPHSKGLLGHSDADVLCHAVTDAILGAAGLGDIGRHFPDTDPAFKDADSIGLLSRAYETVKMAGFLIYNLDAVVIAETPKLSPFIRSMEECVARALGTSPDRVNIKATTTEGLGFEGRKKGIAAWAAVTLDENER
jgi:2-C-methyl-D-erythritol 2,4-cyclodiphosphate synthase